LLLLAGYYSAVLRELCRADFRRFYRRESNQLVGRTRGRLLVAPHLANSLRGAAHRVPCQWDEFTADNLDNRILKQAHLALVRATLRLGSLGGATWIYGLFRGIGSYFDEVADMPVSGEDLRRTRLDRLSSHYRRSLRWARLILRGTRCVRAAREAPQLLIDANAAFEELARLVVRRAIPRHYILAKAGTHLDETLLLNGPDAIPDIQIMSGDHTVAIGDAKYKKVLELADVESAPTSSIDEVLRLRLRADDLYQLYAYQRITQAPVGFLVVPYWSWSPHARAAEFRSVGPFNRSPIDNTSSHTPDHAVAVLGLNMAARPARIVNEAVGRLRSWLTTNRDGLFQR
jgi:5-methylcytosine-specific restriction endonuclease McrBC regulatory subunit McrC